MAVKLGVTIITGVYGRRRAGLLPVVLAAPIRRSDRLAASLSIAVGYSPAQPTCAEA